MYDSPDLDTAFFDVLEAVTGNKNPSVLTY